MIYLGMNLDTGGGITDIEHIRQSVRDILITPEDSGRTQVESRILKINSSDAITLKIVPPMMQATRQ